MAMAMERKQNLGVWHLQDVGWEDKTHGSLAGNYEKNLCTICGCGLDGLHYTNLCVR